MMLKFFNFEAKENDPMIVAYEIRVIMYKIKGTSMQPDLPLVSFLKFLYLTHSHYLEPLQASDKLKDFTFDSQVQNIVDKEKDFGKNTIHPTS